MLLSEGADKARQIHTGVELVVSSSDVDEMARTLHHRRNGHETTEFLLQILYLFCEPGIRQRFFNRDDGYHCEPLLSAVKFIIYFSF